MPRTKSFDEDVVLDRAAELFRERGYEGTSLADLEAISGSAGKASTTASVTSRRFSSGRSIGIGRPSPTGRSPGSTPRTPGSKRFAHSSTRGVESLTAPGGRQPCLVVNTILERGSEDADALLRCNQSRGVLERVLRRALTKAKRTGKAARYARCRVNRHTPRGSALRAQRHGQDWCDGGGDACRRGGAVRGLTVALLCLVFDRSVIINGDSNAGRTADREASGAGDGCEPRDWAGPGRGAGSEGSAEGLRGKPEA